MGGRMGLPGAELERLSIEYNPDEVMIEDPDDMLLVEVRGLLLATDNEVAATDTFAHPEAADGNKGPPEGEDNNMEMDEGDNGMDKDKANDGSEEC